MMLDPRERGGDPEPVHELVPTAWCPKKSKSFGVQLYEAAGAPKEALPWWTEIACRVQRYGGTLDAATFLSDLLDNVRNAADPVARQTKGVGELHNPGGFMYSQCKKFVQERGGSLPPWKG